MMTTTSARLRDLLDMVETWEPTHTSTPTEGRTVLLAAQEFTELADELLRSAVADVRSCAPQGDKIVPDTNHGTKSRTVTTQTLTAADRTNSRWTWAAIGHVLGCSAQAAQQRFRR